MNRPHKAIIAFGSNMGNRRQNISAALNHIDDLPKTTLLVTSSLYETAPVGFTDQPDFLNGVAAVETALDPESLLSRLLDIEKALGRIRSKQWGPRTIDLDLLFYEGEKRNSEQLTLPHPRWQERTFVTIPLREIMTSPLLAGNCWTELRNQLDHLPQNDPGVRKTD